MNSNAFTKFRKSLILAAAMGTALTAHAVDGVVLIDQARVNAAGGFPFRITAPGSYRLAGNLSAPLGKGGIDISAGGTVSLDLNGFSISSTATCTASGLNCTTAPSGAGTPAGIWVHDAGTGDGAVSIANGAVNGFPNFGIFVQVAGAIDIRDIKVFNNSATGILITTVSGGVNTLTSNSVWRNGGSGIYGGDLVTNNSITSNGAVGLVLQPTGAYRGNFLLGNGQGPVSGGVSLGSNLCGYQSVC